MPLGKFAKISISWIAITVASLSVFVISKNSINANRLTNMRARERMHRANEGDYEDTYRK